MSRIIKLEKSLQLKKNIGEIYQRTKEMMHLNMLYLGTPNPVIDKELKKKLSSYKLQDRVKKKHDADKFITMASLVQKLVESQLKCHYCQDMVHITRTSENQHLIKVLNFIGSFSTYCINGFNASDGAISQRNNKTINMLTDLKIIEKISWMEKIRYNTEWKKQCLYNGYYKSTNKGIIKLNIHDTYEI
jgi:hypothetical protein